LAGVTEWSRAPLTLRVYVVLTVAWSLVVAARAQNAFGLFDIGFSVLIAYFLLRGVRWLWFFVVGTTVLGLLTDSFIPGFTITWYSVASGIVGLALLLAPQTRRYFSRGTVGGHLAADSDLSS
jgi:hypothetical protein